MKVYLVGGAVRDKLLGLKLSEKDWVVTQSSEAEMLALGYYKIGSDFPVFLHPVTKEEYALARTERKTSKGYKGFSVDTNKSVTLEEDLKRRDLTINAIAEDVDGNLIDPFGGQRDIKKRILRHVSNAFLEDPLRILRIARFKTKLNIFDFKIYKPTLNLLKKMVSHGDIDYLVPERVWLETIKSLSYKKPSVFFETLKECSALDKVFPELQTINNFSVIDNISCDDFNIKWAVLLIKLYEKTVLKLCNRLKCPKATTEIALLSSRWYEFVKSFKKQKAIDIYDFYKNCDALRREKRFLTLLEVYKVSNISTKPIKDCLKLLQGIDIKLLNKKNIKDEITKARLQIINKYIVENK